MDQEFATASSILTTSFFRGAVARKERVAPGVLSVDRYSLIRISPCRGDDQGWTMIQHVRSGTRQQNQTHSPPKWTGKSNRPPSEWGCAEGRMQTLCESLRACVCVSILAEASANEIKPKRQHVSLLQLGCDATVPPALCPLLRVCSCLVAYLDRLLPTVFRSMSVQGRGPDVSWMGSFFHNQPLNAW